MLSTIFSVAFIVLCFQAALKDITTMTIPNWINLALVALFVPAAFAAGLGWSTAGLHLVTGVIALVVFFGLFAVNAVGGGDAKMIPAVLLWIGPDGVIHFIFGTALAGGALALALILARKAVPAEIAPGFAQKILQQDADIPYAVAIASGAVLAMPASPILSSFLSQFSNFG